jgi:AcrR family transcriptional regulator
MTARERILEAGFGSFLAHGFDGTGLNDILSATGLSKGAFYHHFRSKQALYEEVIARFFPPSFEHIDWAAHALLDAVEQRRAILAMYDSVIETSAANGANLVRYFALFFDSLDRLPAFRRSIEAAYAKAIQALAEAIACEEGVSPGEGERRASDFIAVLEGRLYLWAVTGRRPPMSTEGA